jgi:hypothetical protein
MKLTVQNTQNETVHILRKCRMKLCCIRRIHGSVFRGQLALFNSPVEMWAECKCTFVAVYSCYAACVIIARDVYK